MLPKYVNGQLPNDMASYPRRTESPDKQLFLSQAGNKSVQFYKEVSFNLYFQTPTFFLDEGKQFP